MAGMYYKTARVRCALAGARASHSSKIEHVASTSLARSSVFGSFALDGGEMPGRVQRAAHGVQCALVQLRATPIRPMLAVLLAPRASALKRMSFKMPMTCWLERPFREGILFTHPCGCQVVGMPARPCDGGASGIFEEPEDARRLYPDYVTECRRHQAMTPPQRSVDGLPFASEEMVLDMPCGCTYRLRAPADDKVRHLIDESGAVRTLRSIYRIATCANGQADDDEDPGIYL